MEPKTVRVDAADTHVNRRASREFGAQEDILFLFQHGIRAEDPIKVRVERQPQVSLVRCYNPTDVLLTGLRPQRLPDEYTEFPFNCGALRPRERQHGLRRVRTIAVRAGRLVEQVEADHTASNGPLRISIECSLGDEVVVAAFDATRTTGRFRIWADGGQVQAADLVMASMQAPKHP